MKKCAYSLILFIVFIMIACSDKGSKSGTSVIHNSLNMNEPLTFAVIDTTTKIIMDTLDSNSPYFDIKVSLPFANGETTVAGNINAGIIYAAFGLDSMAPQTAIDTAINSARSEYLAQRPTYINEKSIERSPAWFNYQFSVNGKQSIGYKECINYSMVNYSYMGGAHGLENSILINFDSKSGKEIKLADFFVENYEEPLTNRLLDALGRQLGVTTIEEINEMGYFDIASLYPTENFLLAPDSIIFIYNSYEIAPYSMGITRIALGYNQIENLIK